MQVSLFAMDAEGDGAEEVAVGGDGQLELGEVFLDVEDLQAGAFPKESQTGQIIDISPAHHGVRSVHGGEL